VDNFPSPFPPYPHSTPRLKKKEMKRKKGKLGRGGKAHCKWALRECPSGKQIASSPLQYLMVNNVIS
jgi:hypothetical protein